MTAEELQELARAAEPLSALSEALDGRVRTSYRELLLGFLERLARARNALPPGKSVTTGVEKDLRLMAEALPPTRRRSETGPRTGCGGWRQ
jgi:hypothetical protein